MGIPHAFFANFTVRYFNFYDFLIVSQDGEASLKSVISYRKEFAPNGANSFLKELTFIWKAGRYENGGYFPESVPIQFE